MAFRFSFSRPQRMALLRPALLSIGLLDEVISGFPVVGLPLLRDQLGLSYEQIGVLFSVSALSGMVLDPIISLLSDHGSKRWWVMGGLLGLAVAFALIGSVHNFGLLLVAFALCDPADGAAVGLSQATLIDAAPQESTRTMTRWTLLSSVGDFLSPLVVAAIAALHMGWSALCWLATALWLGAALVLWLLRFPHPRDGADNAGNAEHAARINVWASMRKALRDPVLLRWAALSIIPTMVDEVFLGFVALYLHDVLQASQETIAVIVAIQMAGALLGLFVLDRFLKRSTIAPHRLLFWLAVLVLVAMIAFLSTRSIWFAALMLFVISFGAAGWYPIAQAQAYTRLPGRSGTVRAIVGLGAPFEVALPGVVGLIAGRFGVLAGVGLLGLAPVLIILLVPWRTKR
jgi:predicted MFS family arabinose efflux permease